MEPDIYRRSLGQASKATAEVKARQGIYTGRPLNGYRKVDWTEIHQVDEMKRPFITEAFRLAGQRRNSLRRILAVLQKGGLVGTDGKKLGLSSLHLMLTNPFYAGRIRQGDAIYPGIHEPLVTLELFERVEDNLNQRRC